MTCEPDEHDELVADAMDVGGPAFADELHWSALETTEVVCPWDGVGVEPPEYRQAWLAAARRIIAERRTALGEMDRHSAGCAETALG